MKLNYRVYLSQLKHKKKTARARSLHKRLMYMLKDYIYDLTLDRAPHTPIRKINRRRVNL